MYKFIVETSNGATSQCLDPPTHDDRGCRWWDPAFYATSHLRITRWSRSRLIVIPPLLPLRPDDTHVFGVSRCLRGCRTLKIFRIKGSVFHRVYFTATTIALPPPYVLFISKCFIMAAVYIRKDKVRTCTVRCTHFCLATSRNIEDHVHIIQMTWLVG